MKNNKICKVCGNFSGKSNICLRCKVEQPFKASEKNQAPFKRERK